MALANSVNSSRVLAQNTAYNRSFFMGVASLTLTVTISKNGAAFAAVGGTVSEIANGWYKLALTTTDTNTLGDLAYHATDGGVNVEDWSDQVAILPVKLADGVAHGGTLGSSTATLALQQVNINAPGGSNVAAVTVSSGDRECLLLSGNTVGISLYANQVGLAIDSDVACRLRSNAGDGSLGYTCGLWLQPFGVGGNPGGEALRLIAASADAVVLKVTTSGHGVHVSAAGAGKHDLALTGSGDVQGDLYVDGQKAVQYIAAAVAGKVSGAGSGTETFKGLDGSTTRLTVTVDSSGNRTGISYG